MFKQAYLGKCELIYALYSKKPGFNGSLNFFEYQQNMFWLGNIMFLMKRGKFQLNAFCFSIKVKNIIIYPCVICMQFNPFTAVYKCKQYARGKFSYFDFIMVLHIISYKIMTTVGIYTKCFPACLRHLVQCLKSCFLAIAFQKNFFNS